MTHTRRFSLTACALRVAAAALPFKSVRHLWALWIGCLAVACLGAALWLTPQGRAASAKVMRSLRAEHVPATKLKAAAVAQDKGQPSGKPEPPAEVAVLTQPGTIPPQKTNVVRALAGASLATEVEPNGTTATATPLTGTGLKIRGNIYPNGDIDFYSFTATAGDRFYAAAMTSISAGSSTDSQLTLIASDGTTVIEFDDDNGSFAGLSSSIAGAMIPTTGTYFLRVNDFTAGTTSERPYELWMQLQSGAPTPEVEGNDTPATANALPMSGWVSGARNPAAATEQDWYSFSLNAGDTIYFGLDLDPERDGVVWNGRLGFALFGDASNQILVVDDAGTGDVLPNPNRPSEAFFMTVKSAGTYYAFVDSASAATGGPTATYNLSVTVLPAPTGLSCTTYTSTDVPKTIGPGTGLVSSTITVPGNPRIADIDVDIVLNHALMADIDAHLRSPAGNDNGLFTDIGAAATGGQTQMDLVFDDEAGIPPAFTALKGVQLKPENNSTAGTASTSGAYRLAAFDGENAGGTWTLDLRDDTAGANGGTLTSWSIKVCTPPAAPACPAGFGPVTVFSTDFESGAAGFTHSGAQDEWELGLPATVATTAANPVAAFNTCNSGVNCWKTDLDNTYNASSNQDLLSPNINLAGLSAPIVVTWAQRHQVETANFDHMFVDYQQVGGATPVRLYEWLDPTPISASAGTGNPQTNIGGSYGWGVFSMRADSLAGLNTELRFHLDSDTAVQFAGLAIDDVTVTACRPLSADLSITKTDGVTTAVPGGSVTYTIVASNAGPDPVTGGTVADTFPASLTCTWTCVGAGGGTCTAAGSGNISDTVNLPTGGSVTYTASCTISASATGTLTNTATVSSSVTDPNPANNSATDVDTLTPQANLGITKTDGVTTATPGGSVTYTITASNSGPSNAPGATVSDTFPATLTCTWTCVGVGGGTCTAAGSGNLNDTVNLPSGASVTYAATCSIAAGATGTLSNTATVTAPGGVTDPTPGNNSATDNDTLTPQANLGITKTDGVTTIVTGQAVAYTIVASNAGPSNAPGATVLDTFPAALTCNWTCVGAGGGTCTAAGAGNINDTVNLPAGGSVTYTASCSLSPTATSPLSNTATVAAPGGVTDSAPANNSATDIDTINKANTTTTITADTPDPSVVGQNYTVSASVAVNAPGSGTPTGTITVSDGTNTCTITLPGTSCMLPSTTAGAKSLTATYNGDANFNASPASAVAPHTVNKADTTAAITADTPDPSVIGQNYTVTASVAVVAPGSGTPTGTITVSDGTNSCTITLPSTNCTLPSTTAGAKTLTATYNGDSNFNASPASAVAPHTVNKVNTTAAITADTPDPSVVGQSYTVTASVAVTAPGTGTPTGTITVTDGVNTCTITLPGTSCNLPSTSAGAKNLTATYNGDANFNASPASAVAPHTVNKADATAAITADTPDPSVVGQAVTVNYTVTVVAPGAGVPTGNVIVTASTGESCTGTVAAGACTITFNTSGARTLTATYAGDANFNASPASAAAPHSVDVLLPAPQQALTKLFPDDPLLCAGSVINGAFGQTNTTVMPLAGRVFATLQGLAATPGSVVCTLTPAAGGATTFCNIENGLPTWRGTLAAGQRLDVTYQAQVLEPAAAQVCSTASSQFPDGSASISAAPFCININCPGVAGPGQLPDVRSIINDGKPGSVLIYNAYTSSATGANFAAAQTTTQNTRINLTNTSTTAPVFVHLFFVDGSTCAVADSYLCLTANQTASFLASDLDPGTSGYLVAVAVDRTGCPIVFNHLIGDEYVKFASGHAANLAAEAIAAIPGGLTFCDPSSDTALLRFDGVNYNGLPHVVAVDNVPSRLDGNDTLLILNRLGGSLLSGAATLGTVVGIFYDDAENALSFVFTAGTCQVRSSFSNSFPRLAPRFETFIPAGRSGWLKLYVPPLVGVSGAVINLSTNASGFNQGHNLHKLTLTNTTVYTIPIFPPAC